VRLSAGDVAALIPRGDAGLQGPQGLTGPAGPQGEIGPQGPAGEIGPMGPEGPQGLPGNDGAQGLTGPEGPAGQAGSAGPQGEIGPEGPQGQPGQTGPQGERGFTGDQGLQGIQGPPGPAAVAVYAVLANGATAMDFATNDAVKVTPTANATYTTTVPAAGKERSLIVLTSGTQSRTITFGTGFKPTATLATGTTAARVFVIRWVSDGTNLYEASRTVAMVA
jgi:hypothetical protein